MPDIIIEEDVEEETECNFQKNKPSDPINQQQNENIPQQPFYDNNSLPQYQPNIVQNTQNFPQNYQQSLPQYNPDALKDPNVMILYQQLLESQQRVQQMQQFMASSGNNDQQIQQNISQNPNENFEIRQEKNQNSNLSQSQSSSQG